MVVTRQTPGVATKQRAPVRVDCAYLVTAWVRGNDAQQEHRVLGAVMQVLLRHPTIPTGVLQGALVTQDVPLPTISLQPERGETLQNSGRHWGQTPGGAALRGHARRRAQRPGADAARLTENAIIWRQARERHHDPC
jgi:hypothetical protein